MIDQRDAKAAALEALAVRIAPRPPVRLSQWLSENIVLVDGPAAGQLWDVSGAPYLAEIADCLGDDDPCNLVTVRKSQQSGASILALGWCLYIADREPANTLYAVPGIDSLRDLNTGKLQPLIDAWHKRIGREVIEPQTSRSGVGSTTYEKVFPRGRLWLGNANAVMDLSSKTTKKGVKDELSKWTDIPGSGDPETLYFGRFTAFRRRKNWKILEISTPEVDTGDELGEEPGHCRIDRSFIRSDQRFWHVPCPGCGAFFAHTINNLEIDRKHPHLSRYRCEACDARIGDAERVGMIRAGIWRPHASDPDRHPGFHIDAFISLMMSYEAIAEDFLKSAKSETAKKDFANLVLGLPYQFRGDAPDHVRLMERREDYEPGIIPAKGLMLTAAVDVQLRGAWYEVVAWGSDRQSWVVEAGYIDGLTEDPNGGVYPVIRDKLLDRDFPDAWGRPRRIDALAIDTGYNTNQVYAFVRSSQRLHPHTGHNVVFAVKGEDGWSKPAIGLPKLQDINLKGRKRIKQGVQLWIIGTWPLKSSFFGDLNKLGMKSGQPEDPPGYCHFHNLLDEVYFKQITASSRVDVIVRGRPTGKRWVDGRDNHLLDCRIYNLAVAEHLGLSRMKPAEWATLLERHGPLSGQSLPLFAPPVASREASVPEPGQAEPGPAAQPAGPRPAPKRTGWSGARPGWLRRNR